MTDTVVEEMQDAPSVRPTHFDRNGLGRLSRAERTKAERDYYRRWQDRMKAARQAAGYEPK